jgi:hypothetical protein
LIPQIRPSVYGFRLWLVWNVVAVVLLYAKPWGSFGWDELAVCASPLLLLHPSVRRVNALSIGLVVSSLAWIMAGEPSGGWPELAFLGSVLVVGIAIGDAAKRAEADSDAQTPRVPYLQDEGDIFFFVLGRELSRARRHDSPFAVLSVDQHTATPELSLDSIAELLGQELHAYADTAKLDDRVLALVPEVSKEGQQFLLRRLTSKAEIELGGQIRIGLAHYPQDAEFAEELIELADRRRRAWADAPMEGEHRKVEDTAAAS